MIKKTTSLTLSFSGLLLLFTSFVLYLGPPSHVGHFSSWRFLLISKHHWGALHLNSGILFSLSMLLHIYFNWKPLISYIKNKRGTSFLANKPLYIALALTLFVGLGSYYNFAPMKQIMNYARQLKNSNHTPIWFSSPTGHQQYIPYRPLQVIWDGISSHHLTASMSQKIMVCSPNQPVD